MTEINCNDQKKIYSLRELTPEICEINVMDGSNYEAAIKEVQRIDRVIRNASDYDKSQGILAEHKDRYVKMMRNIYKEEGLKKIISKLGRNKVLKEEEHTQYINFTLRHAKDEEDKKKILAREKIRKKIEELKTRENKRLKLLSEYFDEECLDLTIIMLHAYEQGLNYLHEEIRKECEEFDKIEEARFIERFKQTYSRYGKNHINLKEFK